MGLTSWLRRAWRARDRRVVALGLAGAHDAAVAALPGCARVSDEAGFSRHRLVLAGTTFHVTALDGSTERRVLWPHHYAGAQGVLFVVDVEADAQTFASSALELESLAHDQQLLDVPIAIVFKGAAAAASLDALAARMRVADLLAPPRRHTVTHDAVAAMEYLAAHARPL